MASEIIVNTIKAPTTGANANKVIIPSGVTLDASAGTLNPSAGQIVQVAETSYSTVWTNSTTTHSQIFGLSFTPKFSNSKIMLQGYLAAETLSGNSDKGGRYFFYEDSTQLYNSQYDGYNSSNNTQRIDKVVLYFVVGAGSTNARTYYIRGQSTRAGVSARVNQYGAPSRLIITEIAQ